MKKRMISHEVSGDKTFVSINSSSLDIINTCMRKAEYILARGYQQDELSVAASFGTAIHRALERYYSAPIEARTEALICSIEDEFSVTSNAFDDPQGKRTKESGLRVIRGYIETYRQDRWVIARAGGQPLVEREFEFELFDSDSLQVKYFGRIDAVMQNVDTEEFAVFDHKTTSVLGKEFLSRWNPNHQLTGYVLGARKCFDLSVKKSVINGIRSTRSEKERADTTNYMRVEVDYTESMFEEFTDAVLWNVRKYLIGVSNNLWPLSGGITCSQYGGCQFLDVCSLNPGMRDPILKERYSNEVIGNSIQSM